jgi:hypothetical protein
MTAARHAEVLRERNARRRMLEEAREAKKADGNLYDSAGDDRR